MLDATQVLLILDGHSVGESELSAAGWRVSQQASDRIIVCEDVGAGDPDALRAMPGVTMVTGDVDVSRASPPLNESVPNRNHNSYNNIVPGIRAF